jgi:hypothetical protein
MSRRCLCSSSIYANVAIKFKVPLVEIGCTTFALWSPCNDDGTRARRWPSSSSRDHRTRRGRLYGARRHCLTPSISLHHRFPLLRLLDPAVRCVNWSGIQSVKESCHEEIDHRILAGPSRCWGVWGKCFFGDGTQAPGYGRAVSDVPADLPPEPLRARFGHFKSKILARAACWCHSMRTCRQRRR